MAASCLCHQRLSSFQPSPGLPSLHLKSLLKTPLGENNQLPYCSSMPPPLLSPQHHLGAELVYSEVRLVKSLVLKSQGS